MGKKNGRSVEQKNQGGVEPRVEAKKKETSNEKKEGNSKKETIVLEVYMHCEGCSAKVSNCLKCVEGVEEVNTDMANHRVIVRGSKADPLKVLERIRKKYSRNVELISPKSNPNTKVDRKKEPEKKEEPVKRAVFKMFIHCEGCANDIKQNIERLRGILNVQVDLAKSIVIVRGIFDPQTLVEMIARRLGKHAEIVNTKQESEQVKGKPKEEGKEDKQTVVHYHYRPQYSSKRLYPNKLFSEENILSCSIM